MKDMKEAERELAEGLAEAFKPLVDAIPSGRVLYAERARDHVLLELRDDAGIDSTWMLTFAEGAEFNIERIR